MTTAHAQKSFFSIGEEILKPPDARYFYSVHNINLDFDVIKAFPDSLTITFPDRSTTIIKKSRFEPRGGYIFYDDEYDPPGTPDFWVDENAKRKEFSFLWVGSNDEYDLVISTYKGLLGASFSSYKKRYVVTEQEKKYRIFDVNVSAFPSNADDTNNFVKEKALVPNKIAYKNDKSYTSNLKSFDIKSNNSQQTKDAINPDIIDLLIVYNQAARIDRGGTLAMEQAITEEVDNLNNALIKSGNKTRVTRFHVAELSDFSHSSDGGYDTILNFKNLPSVKELRDGVGADVVMGILEENFYFGACGRAFGQTGISNGYWMVGASYHPWAYSITANNCIKFDYTFTHEFGHVLGTNHASDEDYNPPDYFLINNGFSYAYAWRDGAYKTVNSVTFPLTARKLRFSNPDLKFDGTTISTGVKNEADNSRVIDTLAVYATNFRQRPDLIFVGGFE